jgi:acetyl-CoA carboxylase biotin carboxyl carrier protein
MSGGRFDPETIRALAKILAETGLTEIEIAEGENRVRVARAPAPVAAQYVTAPAPAALPAMPAAPPAPAAAGDAEDYARHPGAVTSPMVGVAYLSPEPGAPPYVQAGQKVAEGQTLLLIEAMKTFNQIKAPRAGTVAQVLVASGAPVEYGEVLVVLE